MKCNGRDGTELEQVVHTSSSILPKQLVESNLDRLSSQSSPRFSFFSYDSHYIKVWHSIYPTGNAVLSQSAGRYFAPLQAEIAPKSPFLCVNRSLILCVFLRGPAKELSGKVWTYERGNDPCKWMLISLTRLMLLRWNCLHDFLHNYQEKFQERDLMTFGKRVTSTSKNRHAHTHIPIVENARKMNKQAIIWKKEL